MRRVRYSVAVSLDGFIAGPNGEIDWIVTDPEVDFRARMQEFDTLLVGRATYELMRSQGRTTMPGMKTIVFSRTLQAVDGKDVTLSRTPAETVAALQARPGKDLWLFGGGSLFRSLLDLGLVDTVELAVIPTLLGAGVPVLPGGAAAELRLTSHRVYEKTGTVALSYTVARS